MAAFPSPLRALSGAAFSLSLRDLSEKDAPAVHVGLDAASAPGATPGTTPPAALASVNPATSRSPSGAGATLDDVSPRTPTTISPPGMTASCILPSTDGVWNAEVDARDTSFATDPAGSPRLPSAATRVRTTTTLGSRP